MPWAGIARRFDTWPSATQLPRAARTDNVAHYNPTDSPMVGGCGGPRARRQPKDTCACVAEVELARSGPGTGTLGEKDLRRLRGRHARARSGRGPARAVTPSPRHALVSAVWDNAGGGDHARPGGRRRVSSERRTWSRLRRMLVTFEAAVGNDLIRRKPSVRHLVWRATTVAYSHQTPNTRSRCLGTPRRRRTPWPPAVVQEG